MRYLPLVFLLAACADPDAAIDERLLARRVALGLKETELAFGAAMTKLEQGRYEPLLARVGSRRLPGDELLDAALEIENLLGRAQAEGVKERAADPAAFDTFLAEARARATALARAAAGGGDAQAEAGALLTGCLDCHSLFRPRR